jgi:tetratricopeptide (TPR) repeat protein
MKKGSNKSSGGKTPEGKGGPAESKSLPATKRKWAFRLVGLLILPAMLAGLELVLRIAGYGYSPAFFRPINISGDEYLVQNDEFSLSVFPKEIARSPGALRMRAHKPPGTFRIFIFGESAAMGDPEPAFGPGRYMEALLRDRLPDLKIEVVNVAFTAINSHVILPIARECARHDGDLWIVYMGNNEMVGPFGAATVFGTQAPPLRYVRLVLAMERMRIGQFVVALARRLSGHASKSPSWGGMQMFLNNQIAPDDPRKEIVYQNFKQNLDDILKAGMKGHAKIILNTVAVNLKDSAPFASLANTHLGQAEQRTVDDVMAQARTKYGQGDFSGASELYERASIFQPKLAELQYNWGQCQLALSNLSAAREHLQNACDDDALPFRADSKIDATIRELAQPREERGVTLLDAATDLAANSPANVCGNETFYEHVHFDFDGSYRLGLLWAQQTEKVMPRHPTAGQWATEEQCDLRLGLSDWNRKLVVEQIIGRLQSPPFSSQPNNAKRIERLQARVSELRSRMGTNEAAAARENFTKQLEHAPDDFVLRENFAEFLQASGDVPASVAEWRRVHELIPHDYLPYFQLGHLLRGKEQLAEADDDLRQALKIRPGLTEGWSDLGNVLVLEGKLPDALGAFAVAQRQRPADAQTVFRIGKVHTMLRQHAEAIQSYHESITLNPANWEAHYELGGELDAAGRLEEAREEFGAAARLNPNHSRAHFNYGVLLAKLGQLDDAQREFEQTMRLEPGYKGASESIAKIQILRQRSKKN